MDLFRLSPVGAGAFEVALEPGPEGRIGLGRGRGPGAGTTGTAVAWLLVEGGEGALAVGDRSAQVGGRADVFESAGWSAMVPPETEFALEGRIRFAAVWRAWDRPLEARVIPPSEVTEEARGRGPDERVVRTCVGEGPLIVGETLNAPGRWSSWPPHRHEQEEVYLYRFDPPHGFGVQVLADGGDEHAAVVRDGRVERIRSGYHPVVAAPGSTMYYLWALAGDRETLAPEVDPRYA